jgi:protein SCO1/2
MVFCLWEFNMNKNAFLALLLVVVVPVICYLVVKHYSDEAVIMPPRYYPDTVISKIENGKSITDTVWHKVKNITLTNQLGKQVSLDDIKGKVIVADFFFTSCPTICPTLTRNMKKLQDAMKIKDEIRSPDSTFIRYLSFSVDPGRDSAPVLKKYADRYGVNHDLWWMLTGSKKEIYEFALNELKMGVPDPETVDTSFIHTTKLVLLDKDRVVRGYYDGTDSVTLDRLARDIVFILMEKEKKKKRSLFGN